MFTVYRFLLYTYDVIKTILTQGINMKKILFLFMMFAGLLSLYASPPNFENTLNLNAGQENVNVSSYGKHVVAAHADKKVNISHKDTILYSSGASGNKIDWKQFENDLDKAIKQSAFDTDALITAPRAVVCLGFDG